MPRFFQGYPWRFIFTDIPTPSGYPGGATTTWAQGLQTARQITFNLNEAAEIDVTVAPDDLRVNQVYTDGYAVVAQSKRIIYALRREGGNPPWVCRAAGIVMTVEDQGDPDIPTTHITAFDPWKLMAARPAVPPTGQLPTAAGFKSWSLYGFRGDQVIANALYYSQQSPYGGFSFIDAGPTYGGTLYYGIGTGSHIEVTTDCHVDIQQGMSVADVWTAVTDSGNCDIVLTPIYDPVNRPGYTHELSVLSLAGNDLPAVQFGWDKQNRAASSIDRFHDASPGSFNNVVQYFTGGAGFPVPLQTNASSITDFGYYWSQQFFPSQAIPDGDQVLQLAMQAIQLSQYGKRTVTLDPIPERAPVPLSEYQVGDRVAVYATDRLRATMTDDFSTSPVQAFRVETIPISVSDDGIETVTGMVLSPDWRQPLTPTPPPPALAEISAATSAATSARTQRQTVHFFVGQQT